MSAMATSPDKQSLRTFLVDTVTLLCKNFLRFESEFNIEGLIGITLDQKDVFLISIHETVKSPDAGKVPAPKSSDADSSVANSTLESDVTAVCDVTLAPNVTLVEDVVQKAPFSRDLTDFEMLDDTVIARQPVILLPDDVKKTGDSPADVKLEVSSLSVMQESSSNDNVYDLDSSSCTERNQNSIAFSLAVDSRETVMCDDSKTFEKVNYSEKSSGRGEGRSVCQSSVFEHSTSSDGHRPSLSRSGDFEVIEIKEESLSEEEFTVSDQNSRLGLPISQLHSQDFSIQGTSSVMDTAYPYWEGNPVNAGQAMNQSTISVTSSAPNLEGAAVKRGPKSKKWKFYECLKCGSKLTTAYGLKKHDTVIHQGNYKYTCHLCGKGLRTEYNLRGHMASRHNMSKDYRCTICAREFGYRHTLRDHMLSCHGVTTSAGLENSGFCT